MPTTNSICPDQCEDSDGCGHVRRHTKDKYCSYDIPFCPKCVPYKEDHMEEQANYKSPAKRYEPTDKPITLWSVLREAPACSKLTVPSFIRHFAYQENNIIQYVGETTALKGWLKCNPKALAWFVDHGFLREVKPEKYFYELVGENEVGRGIHLKVVNDKGQQVDSTRIVFDSNAIWESAKKYRAIKLLQLLTPSHQLKGDS